MWLSKEASLPRFGLVDEHLLALRPPSRDKVRPVVAIGNDHLAVARELDAVAHLASDHRSELLALGPDARFRFGAPIGRELRDRLLDQPMHLLFDAAMSARQTPTIAVAVSAAAEKAISNAQKRMKSGLAARHVAVIRETHLLNDRNRPINAGE